MFENKLLKNKNIIIIGLGLIGASIAMAIKDQCKSLVGVDNDPKTRKKAEKLKLFTQVLEDPLMISSETNILILAVPVESIIHILKNMDNFPCKNAIVIDVGSSKLDIIKEMENLPKSFQPIGGHPICGKENLSIDNADSNLFKNSKFVLTKLERTSNNTCKIALEMLKILKAKPLWMAALDHDQAIACTSHAPYILASALAKSVPEGYSSLVSTGYKSTARLAATPSSMMLDVLLSNRKNIVSALKNIQDNIEDLLILINENNSEELNTYLSKSSSHHKKLISD